MYKCKVCGARFYSTVDSAAHLKRQHPDQDPGSFVYVEYRCEVCGGVFGHRTDLKNHALRDHGIQRPAYIEMTGER